MAKLALLIGVSEYAHGFNPLPSAKNDVQKMKEVLEDPEMGGFTQVETLIDPGTAKMNEKIDEFFCRCQRNDLVLLYFSGHGITDGNGSFYFATSETRKNLRGQVLPVTALSASLVKDIINRSPSKRQVFILDCCYSAAFIQGAKDGTSVNVVDIQKELGEKGRAILTSSNFHEKSFEDKRGDISTYTRYIVEGIETGDADQDHDLAITVRELNQYVQKKVPEADPRMNPQYDGKNEGYDIKLAKVKITDPKRKYRQAVESWVSDGDISSIGKSALNILQNKLGLTSDAAYSIEYEVLTPHQEREEKIKQYEDKFNREIRREYPLTPRTLRELKRFQEQSLELKDEDIKERENRIIQNLREQRLQEYQQNFRDAINQGKNPNFDKQRYSGILKPEDIKQIEESVTAEQQTKLQEYEQEFLQLLKDDYPDINLQNRARLNATQRRLELKDEEIKQIEKHLTEELKQKKLQEYEQELREASQRENPITDNTRAKLKATQQRLRLIDEDITRIEQDIQTTIREKQNENWQKYEEEFRRAIQQEFPVRYRTRQDLIRLQQTLGLSNEQIELIEDSVLNKKQKNLQQYEHKFSEAINREYPISANTRHECIRLQASLELREAEIAKLERRLISQREKIIEPLPEPKPEPKPRVNLPFIAASIVAFFGAVAFIIKSIQPHEPELQISYGQEILLDRDTSTNDKKEGVKAFIDGNFMNAITKFKSSLKTNPNDPETLIYLNNAEISNKSALKIAVSVPISSNPDVAKEILRGVAQAQDEVNKNGGINWRLRVEIANDRNEPEIAERIAKKFVNDGGILAVIGNYYNNDAIKAAEVYKNRGLVMISPDAKSPSNLKPPVFHTLPDLEVVAKELANYAINTAGLNKIAICADSQSDLSLLLKKKFTRAIQYVNGQVVEPECNLYTGKFNTSTINGANGILLLPAMERLDKVINIAVKAKQKKLTLLGSPIINSHQILKLGRSDINGMVVVVPWNPTTGEGISFANKAKNLWNASVNWRTAMAYDATTAIIEGLKQDQTRDGLSRTLSRPDFSFTGVTGKVEFHEDREPEVALLQVQPNDNTDIGYEFAPIQPNMKGQQQDKETRR